MSESVRFDSFVALLFKPSYRLAFEDEDENEDEDDS